MVKNGWGIICLLFGIIFSGHAQTDTFPADEWDDAIFTLFPTSIPVIVSSNISTNADGLIGRNLEWGQMYSARFQLGSGYSLRFVARAGEEEYTAYAFNTVMAGINSIEDDGNMPSDVPAELKPTPTTTVSYGDRLSAAAFFLGDACIGIATLQHIPTSISQDQIDFARERLALAIGWLAEGKDILAQIDAHAPNRLLFDARAFQACSSLTTDPEFYQSIAQEFVDKALLLLMDEGYFLEGDGWDTTYQAVAIRVGNDVLGMGYSDEDNRLNDGLNRASDWLLGRIDEQGRVDSTDNARTCWAQEQFLGSDKYLSVIDVFLALAYRGVAMNDDTYLDGAIRVETWALNNPNENPCFGTPPIG